jgi:hypothetical protein
MNELQTELEAIKDRNARVEADKAWETSWTRRLFIALITYCVAALYMSFAGLSPAFLGAFIPTGGYLLSTLSIPHIRRIWQQKAYKRAE